MRAGAFSFSHWRPAPISFTAYVLTHDGRAKILDFGLAKLEREPAADDSLSPTQSGVIMGTVGYMAPEQARGRAVDHRADIFSLAAVAYEMLSGQRAFDGETPMDRLSAILTRDPAPLSGAVPGLPPGLESVVRRCLEKVPAQRFQSARDLAFALESLVDASGDSGTIGVHRRAPAPWRRALTLPAGIALLGVAACLAVAAMIFSGWPGGRTVPLPSMQRVTFRSGVVAVARFAPDGQSIVHGARWDGGPFHVYSSASTGNSGSPLMPDTAVVLDVSPQGEMAVLLQPTWRSRGLEGILATVPLAGGQPREVRDRVREAAYDSDGRLVLLRHVDSHTRIETLDGKLLLDRFTGGSGLSCSASGGRIAWVPDSASGVSGVEILEPSGRIRRLPVPFRPASCIWAANGKRFWLTSEDSPDQSTLWTLEIENGRVEAVMRFPVSVVLHDCSRSERLLMERNASRAEHYVLRPGAAREVGIQAPAGARNLGCNDTGKWLMLIERGTPDHAATSWLQPTDSGPATRFAGWAVQAVSPDEGQFVAFQDSTHGGPR